MIQKLAWILIAISVVGLVGWGVYAFFADSEVPLMVKIALGSIGAGALILLGVAIKDRLTKSEPNEFKEVDN